MISRELKPEDIYEIRELHEKFYSDSDFPDFLNGFLCGFVITDEKDKIVMAGGVQPIGEIIIFADKDENVTRRVRALLEIKNISLYVGKRFSLDELVAFTKDEDFARHLIKHGFFPRSPALGIKV